MPDIHYPQVAIAQKKNKKRELAGLWSWACVCYGDSDCNLQKDFQKKKKRGKMSSRASWKYLELKPQNI